MTIAPVHRPTGYAFTLEEWRALDPTGNNAGPSRPVTDRQIGSTTAAKRDVDATASAHFTETDRPALRAGWRAVGPRGHATREGDQTQ